MITKVFLISFGDEQEGGGARCAYASLESAITKAKEMVEEEQKKFSDHMNELVVRDGERVLDGSTYREDDGTLKSWKEISENYWSNTFNYICINEMEVISANITDDQIKEMAKKYADSAYSGQYALYTDDSRNAHRAMQNHYISGAKDIRDLIINK